MEKILGNYLTQANRDFPLDAETLDYLQTLTAISAIIGNIAGDKAVLQGCEAYDEGTRRGAGWVFLRTRERPEGEVLYWEGGATGSGMYVKQEDVSVTANNNDYPKAYTRRSLAPGYGTENYKWDDFTDIKTIKELMRENAGLRVELAGMQAAPLGIVEMWAGSAVPEGYVLCDGRALGIKDYPGLYAALGTTFNTAMSAGGTRYAAPAAGTFRVPDLQGRFVVGCHESDNDYKGLGDGGGVKRVALTAEHMPAHGHEVKDYMMIPHGTGECTTGEWTVGGTRRTVGYDALSGNPKRTQTDNDKRGQVQWIKHPTDNAGGGMSHENRPPYYVLAYIMKAK